MSMVKFWLQDKIFRVLYYKYMSSSLNLIVESCCSFTVEQQILNQN